MILCPKLARKKKLGKLGKMSEFSRKAKSKCLSPITAFYDAFPKLVPQKLFFLGGKWYFSVSVLEDVSRECKASMTRPCRPSETLTKHSTIKDKTRGSSSALLSRDSNPNSVQSYRTFPRNRLKHQKSYKVMAKVRNLVTAIEYRWIVRGPR